MLRTVAPEEISKEIQRITTGDRLVAWKVVRRMLKSVYV